jgi:hypothetical protein
LLSRGDVAARPVGDLDQAERLGDLLGGSARCEPTEHGTGVSAVLQDSGPRAVVGYGLVVGSGRRLGP